VLLREGGKGMSSYGKNKDRKHVKEQNLQAFRCGHCHAFVVINAFIGTVNRNHCNFCLWSKHVDIKKGDRNSECQSGMKPIGLTLKREGFSKWGELMLIHVCSVCNKISINRIAGDDDTDKIITVLNSSFNLNMQIKQDLEDQFIDILIEEDKEEVQIQLFGK
jgi:hypothetical protein